MKGAVFHAVLAVQKRMVPEMKDGEKRAKPTSQFRDRIRIFACWSHAQEERYLEKQAARGWRLYETAKPCIYRFVRAEPVRLRYAVEYMGGLPDVPEQIAEKCNDGWEFVGRFGEKRFYFTEAAEPPPHPSRGNTEENRSLRSAQGNLTTAGLLNLPGTFYCFMYLLLFIGDGGFYVGELFTADTGGWLYLFGAALGVASIVYIVRCVVKIQKRLRQLGLRGSVYAD